MILPISPAARRELRASAHPLHPVVTIGHGGLTPAVLHEIDVNLLAHELIKIRVLSGERGDREALQTAICEALDAAPVQHIGKLLIVFRPTPEAAPDERPVARRKAAAPASRPRVPAGGGPGRAGKARATGAAQRSATPLRYARDVPASRRRRARP